MTERRRLSGLGMSLLTGMLVLLLLGGPIVLISVPCPRCEGGAIVQVSIGVIPCSLCRGADRVSAARAAWFRVAKAVE